jgi:Ca2+-binding RTX toxin-like protein
VEGDAIIRLGSGDNNLAVFGVSTGGQLGVFAGEGNDEIRLHQINATRVRVNAGPGNDTVSLERIHARSLFVATGEGDDRVRIVGAVLHEMGVDLGAGNDRLAVGDTVVRGPVVLQGGDGDDTLIRLGGNRWRNAIIRGFENGTNQDVPENSLVPNLA